METIRVALIGKTGAGKSALGNTLLGKKQFKSTAASESVTIKCEAKTGILPNGRAIRVVDTPGIMDTEGRDVRDEVTKAIAALSPGPHAFLIVLQPGRATAEEKKVIKQLRGLFGDEAFMEHTIIVMTRKADIQDENEDPISIQQYMHKYAADDVKDLYRRCGRRIVAVENKHASEHEKQKYAQEVIDEVVKMGGFYSHAYFKLMQQKKIQEEETRRLRREIERVAAEQERGFCSIL
ncbi:GTPase IMAP family member 7-like [Mytilus trossulus]|uniref:GTPase IMAP family member 7-like n=1 Tax=Mytilus trossulus TaxID=6551 RepID=UPI003006DA2D